MLAALTESPMEEKSKMMTGDNGIVLYKGVGVADKEAELKQATVRKDFRSTVLWQPVVTTDAHGKAKLTVKFPDSLTTWRATARSHTKDTSVGNITHETRTKKDVIVRLQAPRF